jgi:acetolactate synthase-1/2/3 large subunit
VLNKVNFAQIAESMGAMGIRVEKPADLKGALQKAFEADRPVIIDVVSDIEAMAPLPFAP